MTRIEQEAFMALTPSQLLNQAWTKGRSPTVKFLIEWANTRAGLFAMCILVGRDPKERALQISKCIGEEALEAREIFP
jgi:hypothetical protein